VVVMGLMGRVGRCLLRGVGVLNGCLRTGGVYVGVRAMMCKEDVIFALYDRSIFEFCLNIDAYKSFWMLHLHIEINPKK
jgi:hypothetical protein